MSDQGIKPTRLTLEVAERIAAGVLDVLRPHAEFLEVAGSVRRRRPVVGDLDLVMLPKRTPNPQMTFGGGPESEVQERERTAKRLSAVVASMTWNRLPGELDGDKYKRWYMEIEKAADGSPQFAQVDLFITAEPERLQTLFLVKTGSKEHNIRLANAALQVGWEFKANGDGLLDHGKRVAWRSEREIFAALGLPYKEPPERE